MPTSYTIGEHFEGFIDEQVRIGRYVSASVAIRTALALLEDWER